MASYVYRLQAWWSGLATRERQLLLLVVASAFIIYLVFGLWKPLQEGERLAQQRVKSETELLQWVTRHANQIESLRRAGGVSATRQPLNRIVATSSNEFSIKLIRIQPRGEELQVWIEPTPFNQLMDWIHYLSTQQGIQVSALDIEKADQSGVVEVRRLQLK